MTKGATKAPMTLIGLMSGTSVDSVDACCVDLKMTSNEQLTYEILGTHTEDFPLTLREKILHHMGSPAIPLETFSEMNEAVGTLFGKTAFTLMKKLKKTASEVTGIASHGQTLYHHPPQKPGEKGSTLQIGDPKLILKATGVTTISNFRQKDMAVGGQGAPLVCFADQHLFQHPNKTRCIQNIGGIGNVTFIPPKGQGQILAFDTGPGNMLLDGAMHQLFHEPYDKDGTLGSQGKVNPSFLAHLMHHAFLKQAPPKSTGREAFGADYLQSCLHQFSTLPKPDILATLTAYTAESIADAYQHFIEPYNIPDEVIVGGGGTKNPTLMSMLEKKLLIKYPHIQVKTHEDYGIPNQYKEALAFAMLGWATLNKIPNNIPSCTGATEPVVLGKITLSTS